MAKYKLNLSAKADNEGKKQVLVRITVDRETRIRFKSDVWVLPQWFSEDENRIIPQKESKKAESELSIYLARLDKVLDAMKRCSLPITTDSLKRSWDAVKHLPLESVNDYALSSCIKQQKQEEEEQRRLENKKSFFELAEIYMNEKIKEGVSQSWVKGYRVLFRALSRYEMFVRMTDVTRKDFVLDVDEITKEDVESIFDYLANEKQISMKHPQIFKKILNLYPAELTPKHHTADLSLRGENMIIRWKKLFKRFYKWLNEHPDNEPYTRNNPCTAKVGSEKYGDVWFLTREERETVANFPLSGRLAELRDIFIFQCLTGCRVEDLIVLTPSNVNGNSLIYVPKKTMKSHPGAISFELHPKAFEIVERYQTHDNKGRLLPFISAQKYNDALKVIMNVCGIDRKVSVRNSLTGIPELKPIYEVISSHCARRTFCGLLYCETPDPTLIGSVSGHAEGSTAFRRYVKVTDEMKRNLINKL